MMDDSEAQMETDVSSTTTDMPEAQEITRSSGNVEMIIVVEQIKDEEEEETFSSIEKSAKSDEETQCSVIQSMNSSEETTEKKIALSQTLIADFSQKGKSIAEVNELKDPSLSPTEITPKQSEQSLTPFSTKSHSKTATSSMQVESLTVDADSSSKMSSCVEDSTIDSIEYTVQSEQYKSQSDHQYAAKNCPESVQLTGQPVIDAIDNNSVSTEIPITSSNEVDKLICEEKEIKIPETLVPIDTQQKEISNVSQTKINSETTEKEHNKSISRELKSLINSAKESKIISECTQLTSKTRKSRVALDSANTSLNSEAEKIQGIRRSSNNSQKSSCSEKSDKTIIKRSMRSQNPEFVNKVKQFLNSVTGKGLKNDSDTLLSDEEMDENKSNENHASAPKKKKMVNDEAEDKTKLRSDLYCWRCHWAVEQAVNEKTHHPMLCTVCPRSFHYKCLSGTERAKINTDKSWVCPECLSILHAESSDTRSHAMKKVSLGMLCELLKYALERMLDLNVVEPFMEPVDRTAFPDYDKYVVHPMDLTLMKNNINEGLYGSTEAFLADAQWILHNSIIFNTLQSKLTSGARALVRSCRTEMAEIEACPECYSAAHARRPTWFTDVCSTPHILLWAKLKGFPHWPAKGMSVNNTLVDVRFFGAHDRAWVPAKDCYLYSEKDPNSFRTKRQDILDSMQEAEEHIRNISRKYGKFVYPPFKTLFDPSKLAEQLKLMIPSFKGEVRMPSKEKSGATPQTAKEKRLSSKNSKSSLHDGDTSEGDEVVVIPTRKMADGAEIAKEEEDYSINEKNKTTPVNNGQQKSEMSRKRRRSELEEAVITILDCSSTVTPEKRKRCDNANSDGEDNKNTDKQNDNTVIKETPVELANKLETNLKKNKEQSNSINEKNDVVESTTPIILAKIRPENSSTPKEKENIDSDINDEVFLTPKQGPSKLDKSNTSDKEDKQKTPRRWNSKNKYLNAHVEKCIKNGEKTNDKSVEITNVKDKKENNHANNKGKDNEGDKMIAKKNVPLKTTGENQKSIKDRIKFDDNTSLAVIARVAKSNVITHNVSCLPTISSVRSLSVTSSNECSPPKISDSVEITIEETSISSIFTPTNTDNVRNMKEAVSKLKKLRNASDLPSTGRVGVRAFARMTSPETVSKDKELMQIEIKTEPVDLDEVDRHNEKMDLMNAFKLRPVKPVMENSLRELKINKVVVAPINARKNTNKHPEIRIKAKKTFPQPKKVDEARSELNGKNSMVYIPIQPPMTQAPIRGVRPIAINASNPRLPAPVMTPLACNINTVTAPLISHSTSVMPNVSPATTNTCNTLSTVSPIGQLSTTVPTVRQTSVQSVPFLTSLNGQWTFSLQPIMSLGGVDDSTMPVVNGVAEQATGGTILPIASQSAQMSSQLSPALNSNAIAIASPIPSANSTQINKNDTLIELPKLQQRPPLLNPLDANTPMGCVPPPSTAGPLTAKLNQNAVKLTDFFRNLLEDSLEKVDEPMAQLTTAKLQLEQAKWQHRQEIDEIKHNHELVLAEIRASFEKEKSRAVNEVWRSAQAELDAAVKLAKSKQWCANCTQESQFYCCWNTSYCDYPCQRAHWSKHFSVCTQKRQDSESADGEAPPLDNARYLKDNLPKSTQAPTLAVGNQLNSVRVLPQDQPTGAKPSILVSMVENSGGNQTMKCVGTFKPQPPSTQTPLIINKQIMNREEAAKKVVTSGGYLIVGGGSTTTTTSLTTQRRPPTIQYFT